MSKKTPKFHCKSEAQKKAIRKNYAIKAKQKPPCNNGAAKAQNSGNAKKEFPKDFPFWARLKISKRRTTLVIDEAPALDKQKKEMVDGYVHREATSQYHKGFEEIYPNPDKDKDESMYLKSPRKLPKYFFEPHNKDLDMPENLRQRYEKNNHKDRNDKKE